MVAGLGGIERRDWGIGIAQELSTYWFPAEYKVRVALLLLMVMVMALRPQKLFRRTM